MRHTFVDTRFWSLVEVFVGVGKSGGSVVLDDDDDCGAPRTVVEVASLDDVGVAVVPPPDAELRGPVAELEPEPEEDCDSDSEEVARGMWRSKVRPRMATGRGMLLRKSGRRLLVLDVRVRSLGDGDRHLRQSAVRKP